MEVMTVSYPVFSLEELRMIDGAGYQEALSHLGGWAVEDMDEEIDWTEGTVKEILNASVVKVNECDTYRRTINITLRFAVDAGTCGDAPDDFPRPDQSIIDHVDAIAWGGGRHEQIYIDYNGDGWDEDKEEYTFDTAKVEQDVYDWCYAIGEWMLSKIIEQWEYLQSEEYLLEWADINDFRFRENGTPC